MSTVNAKITNKLKEVRLAKHLSGRDLTDKMNQVCLEMGTNISYTDTMIYKIERQERRMTDFDLVVLSKALDCSIDTLLGLDNKASHYVDLLFCVNHKIDKKVIEFIDNHPELLQLAMQFANDKKEDK